jgi:hypothetical protein
MTLVVIGTRIINGQRFEHGSELPPNLLARDEIDKMLDRRQLAECHPSVRRSLYRLFSHFSGCNESEQLSPDELKAFALPP